MREVKVWDFTDQKLIEIFRQSEAADVITIPQIENDFLSRVRCSPQTTGYPLPWNDTHEHVRLRTGEVSVWAGINPTVDHRTGLKPLYKLPSFKNLPSSLTICASALKLIVE